MDGTIYLDHNATTPVHPGVLEAMLPWFSEHAGNPASGHRVGRVAAAIVERARADVAGAIGSSPAEVVFTSGATESNNLVLRGVTGGRVVVSAIEHRAVLD